jgi:Cu/Ag efflux pump CusA
METPKEHVQSLFSDAKDYLSNKSQLWKLKMIDKTSETVSSIVEKVIIFFIAIIFFFLLNIAIALLIGHWLNHSFYGFFILAAFYGIVGLVIHLSKDKLIKTPIINGLIQKFVK